MEILSDYKNMITDLVQKQMVVLGPNIALDKAKNITGLKVSDDGTVLDIVGNPALVLKSLAGEYVALSGQIAKMNLDSLFEKYPQVKNI